MPLQLRLGGEESKRLLVGLSTKEKKSWFQFSIVVVRKMMMYVCVVVTGVILTNSTVIPIVRSNRYD